MQIKSIEAQGQYEKLKAYNIADDDLKTDELVFEQSLCDSCQADLHLLQVATTSKYINERWLPNELDASSSAGPIDDTKGVKPGSNYCGACAL